MGRITNELFGPRVCLKNLAMNKHHSFFFFFPPPLSVFFFFFKIYMSVGCWLVANELLLLYQRFFVY